MKKLALLIILLAAKMYGQGGGNPIYVIFPGAPSGSCASISQAVNTSTGAFYTCSGGNWVQITASGSGNPSTVSPLGSQYLQTNAPAGKNLWVVTFNSGNGQVLWTNSATGQTQATGSLPSSVIAAYDMVTPGSGTTLNDVSGNGKNANIGTFKNQQSVGSPNGVLTTFSGTLASVPIAPGSMLFAASGITGICYDNGSGLIVGGGCSAGTINYTTGAYSITFTSAPTNAGVAYTSYVQISGGPTWGTTGLTFSATTGAVGPYIPDISSNGTLCAMFNQSTNGDYPLLAFSGATTGGNSIPAQFIASEWTTDHTPYWSWGNVFTPATSGSNQYAADSKWHLWCLTANGSTTTTYIDGNQVGSTSTSYTPQVTTSFPLSIGTMFSNSSYFQFVGILGYGLVANTSFSQPLLRWLTADLSQVMTGRSAVFAPQTVDTVIFDGDSRSTNFSAQTWESSYPYQTIQLLGSNLYTVNVAIGGQTCVQRLAAAPTQVDPLILGSRKTIVLMEMGTNDVCLTASNTAVAEACLLSYAQGRKALGAKVFWQTLLPRKVASCTNGSEEADRQTVNTFMRANVGGAIDGVIDVGEDPVIGQSSDITNATYYQSDQTHLVSAANSILANDSAVVLKNLLGIPSASNSLIAADIVLGAGWGTTASVGSVLGTEGAGTFTVTSAGTGQSSGTSTITISFSNPAFFQQAPQCSFAETGGSVLATTSTWVTSLSSAVATLTATYNTLPIANDTYTFTYQCK